MDESVVEVAALDWLESIGWTVTHGHELGPDGADPERQNYEQVVLEYRLRQSLVRLNTTLPAEAVEAAFRKLTRPEGPTLETRNRAFHRMLTDGVTSSSAARTAPSRRARSALMDFDDPDNNDWLVVNQFTVIENRHDRRPDVVRRSSTASRSASSS